MSFASLPQLPISTLQVMRRCLVSRANDSSHSHDQSDQIAAIDVELARHNAAPIVVAEYRLSDRKHGSTRLGPCEVCRQPAATVYLQTEVLTKAGRRYGEGRSLFGHQSCLEDRRQPIGTVVSLEYATGSHS